MMKAETTDGTPMPTPSQNRVTVRDARSGTAHIALVCLAAILWLAWQMVRLPLLTLLMLFEPIVSFLLSALALLTALSAILWVFADPKAHFPFWTDLAGSLACVLVLALYHALMRALSAVVPFRSCDSRSTARR